MATIIGILGNKGGTGKTTLTHLVAHGLALAGHRVVAATTDAGREPLSKQHRRYLPVDARTPEALEKVAAKLANVDGWYGVLDGGANRPQTDERLAALADLVLLPFRDSPEDLRVVLRDLERFPGAYALPSQWPTNVWQREAAERALGRSLGGCASRILRPVPAISATKQLLEIVAPVRLPPQVDTAARDLADTVLARLGHRRDATDAPASVAAT